MEEKRRDFKIKSKEFVKTREHTESILLTSMSFTDLHEPLEGVGD